MNMVTDLHYGPPGKDSYCAYQYTVRGVPRPDFRCPNWVHFYVKIEDGRGDDWRKARAACAEHLHLVVWQMAEDYEHSGEFLLRSGDVKETRST